MQDSDIDAEPWQVTDYRRESISSLTEQLSSFNINLDRQSFVAYADTYDSPEALADEFYEDTEFEPEIEDYIYLIVFELWRRFVPEKQTMSLFCDELDYQINLYDQDKIESFEPLEDALANLQYLLNEQVDQGANPMELFENIKNSCANDLENFLYDFISLQIENENLLYATEVLEGFHDYVDDPKWFALLKARLLIASDPEEASDLMDHLLELTSSDDDIDFHMEFLTLLVQEGEKQSFVRVLNTILSLIETEEEFIELLELCEDYFHCLDEEKNENRIQKIISSRSDFDIERKFKAADSHVSELQHIFGS